MRLRIRAAAIVIALLAIGASMFFVATATATEAEPGEAVVGVKIKRPARLIEPNGRVEVPVKVRCQGAKRLIVDVEVTQQVGDTVVTAWGFEYVDPCANAKVVVRPEGEGFVPGRADVTAKAHIYDDLNVIGRATDTRRIRICG